MNVLFIAHQSRSYSGVESKNGPPALVVTRLWLWHFCVPCLLKQASFLQKKKKKSKSNVAKSIFINCNYISIELGRYELKLSRLRGPLENRAPHSWIYNILPHYRIYNSKLISKKFPKKLKALLVDIQLRTGNFSRF